MAKTKIPGEYLKDSVVRFTAKAGENITKGQSVYISGISGEVPVVSLADADDTNKMPAFGLAESTVSTNGSIEVTSNGTLAGIDTSSYTLGDILYISTTAGSLTNDPSGLEASKVQNIGMVQRVHASNGSIKVGGAGRTNATPNLNDGNIFVGNSSNKSVSDAFTDVLNDQAGINSSANATAITIDSSENVGIGNSNPSAFNSLGATDKLVIGDSTDSNLTLFGTTYGSLAFADSDTSSSTAQYAGLIQYYHTNNSMQFYTASAERMRIDSSGNLLVGTTSNAPTTTAGINLGSNNKLHATRSGGTSGYFNRLSSDGGIVEFAKDGTTVGSIGSASGVVSYIVLDPRTGVKGAGLLGSSADANTGILQPTDNSGSTADAAIQLGTSSNRFKDLYLSGAAYVPDVRSTTNQYFTHQAGNFAAFRDSNGSERMRIDSSGNVGIGDTSPSSITSSVSTLSLNGTDTGTSGGLAYKVNGTDKGYHYVSSNFLLHQAVSGVGHRFLANNAEAMRIDSSGNLLVGTTNNAPVSNNVAGVSIRNFGEVQSSVNGAAALYLNRKTSDGDMAVFRKDGSGRGQIGTYGGTLYIGSVSGGIMFNGTDIEPTSGGAGRADNSIDLGSASYRFKDAFLGDGVYLGGTGSANKLDDYEEGNFTLTLSGGTTAGTQSGGSSGGRYTKIGRVVTCSVVIANTTLSGAAGNLVLTGFPFVTANYANRPAVGVLRTYNQDLASPADGYFNPTLSIEHGVNYAVIVQTRDNGTWSVVTVENSSSLYFEGTITYVTS